MATDANRQLLAIIPLLVKFELTLRRIYEKFQTITQYKNFRLHVDAPSIIPTQETKELVGEILKLRKELLEFKKSFNENDLDEELRKIFLEIFIQITKKDELIRGTERIVLGDGSLVWKKLLRDVINGWETMKYEPKYGYSMQCYNFVKGYFPLADLIRQLEEKVTS